MSTAIKNNTEVFLNTPLQELVSQAGEVRRKFIGNKLDLCSILNARSGLCSEDCKFCAQSARHHADISTYPLKGKYEIVEAAQKAKDIGAKRFGIVTSGNRLTGKELDVIAQAISEIKNSIDIVVCASLGALEKSQLQLLKDAGLSRYHHNIETSRRFYPHIVSTHTFDERINTIKSAKQVGLEVCSGGIIGMGETWQDRIDMAYTLKELDVDSVPLNILIPIKGTPLESITPLSADDAVRAICIFRIVLKDKTVKIAAGREAIFKDSQLQAFTAGANGMLIGGYLTVKGANLDVDYALIEEIKRAWTE
ncbi:MAG: biotin synthase BioB [Phycisphaerae bacterium]|nr:biotin synthase BioB [Phycisphaerae bacterium]MDD5380976.1 biotin synthase BioB [Phycisphaerae bacterium]